VDHLGDNIPQDAQHVEQSGLVSCDGPQGRLHVQDILWRGGLHRVPKTSMRDCLHSFQCLKGKQGYGDHMSARGTVARGAHTTSNVVGSTASLAHHLH
jgi:hypothetical protein